MRFASALAFVLLTTACSSGTSSGGEGGSSAGGAVNSAGGAPGGTTGAGGSSAGGAPGGTGGLGGGEQFSVSIGPIPVTPGFEDTECVVKRLNNPNPIKVGRIFNQLGGFSHHLIVYKSTDTEERPDPFPCVPFLDTLDPSKGSPLLVSQKADDELVLPSGVGFELEANQMIRLELHYINTQPNTADVTATANFESIPEDRFEHAADFMFLGSPDISIDPRSTDSLTAFLTLPPELSGVNFFALTGHTHQWGTDVRVWTALDVSDPGTPVYDVDSWLWDEPETVIHDPPFNIPAGGGLKFQCDWDNMSDRQVGFGESVNQEMCFFWAYYYPSQGSRVCLRTEQFGGGIDACCPGNPLCSLVQQFL